MKTSYGIGVVAAAALSAALLMGQAPETDEAKAKAKAAAKAKQIKQNFENNAREITIYDRQGKVVKMLGPRALFQNPNFSPDGTRLAVIKNDQEGESTDIWVFDLAGGGSTKLTNSQKQQSVRAPNWSPDSRYVAYIATRDGNEGLYRKAANGEGQEELLYQLPGAGIILTDWSPDGRYLCFFSQQLGGNIVFALPLEGERKPIEIVRSQSQLVGGRLSANSRFLAYRSNEGGSNAIWVQAFNPSGAGTADKWKVSGEGALAAWWRADGQELFYLASDRGIMSVDVGATIPLEFGKPKLLFKLPDSVPVTGTPGGLGSISRDGQRVAFIVPPAPQVQQISVLDRQGKVLRTVGEPGAYAQAVFSPDESRIAVLRTDRDAGKQGIWVYDMATGRGTEILSDQNGANSPIWSPDGSQILYTATRGSYSAIYRKASNGTGQEEMLFRYTPGAGMNLTDISPYGNLISFTSGGVVFAVRLAGSDPLARPAIEVLRDEFNNVQGRFSPDGKFLAYGSNEADPERANVYVRPFNVTTATAGDGRTQVSKDGANGMLFFRQDGKEMYWVNLNPLTGEGQVLASEIATTPAFQAAPPKLLFTIPDAQQKINSPGSISRDGQRFVFTMNLPR